MHLHILGIGGTLMGSIALLAKEQGLTVTGSDENIYPPMSTQLADAGIEVRSPYSAENIPKDVDLVMIGNANLPRGNVAVEYVLDRGLPYISGAEWLGRYLLHDKWVIAVSGTHGKTTTTSMIAWILDFAGLQPGFLVGGVPGNFGYSARIGATPFFVIEADEYDTSYFDRRSKFVHYRPRTLVINNLEFDHADIFADLGAIQQQFHLLLRTVPSTGLVIHPAKDQAVLDTLELGCWSETLSFGEDAPLSATDLEKDYSSFDVLLEGKVVGRVDWELSGLHNQNNALAAIAAARHIGVKPDIAAAALSEFKGVKRRMELIYESATLTVYDDFAHHPTAIQTTLQGFRHKVGTDSVLAIIEPGSHTMRKGTHAQSLAESTSRADQVIWFQPPNMEWQMAEHISGKQHQIVVDRDQLVEQTIACIKNHSIQHVIIMSNSGFGGFQEQLKSQLPR
ncbi:MAG: UDP-N-acetylmuramate: L-alanyl-gamma-D-glutamyl-meso-diaminopimelate ligase [Candidatus Azotimanducaceae bacterium]|jgi:UDP-N-acetylmuramate: L-alanyl-gamma-D-glutamyl-meso-diaminopimelate ligase